MVTIEYSQIAGCRYFPNFYIIIVTSFLMRVSPECETVSVRVPMVENLFILRVILPLSLLVER